MKLTTEEIKTIMKKNEALRRELAISDPGEAAFCDPKNNNWDKADWRTKISDKTINKEFLEVGKILLIKVDKKGTLKPFISLGVNSDGFYLNVVDKDLVMAFIGASSDDVVDEFAYFRKMIPKFIVKHGETGKESIRVDYINFRVAGKLFIDKITAIKEATGHLTTSAVEKFNEMKKKLIKQSLADTGHPNYPNISTIKSEKRVFNVGDVLWTKIDTRDKPIGQGVVIVGKRGVSDGFEYSYFTNGESSCSCYSISTIRNGRTFIAPSKENGLKKAIGLHIYDQCHTSGGQWDILTKYDVIGQIPKKEIDRIELAYDKWEACAERMKEEKVSKEFQEELELSFIYEEMKYILKTSDVTEDELNKIDIGWTHCVSCLGELKDYKENT